MKFAGLAAKRPAADERTARRWLPIMCAGDLVRSILADRKTETRRRGGRWRKIAPGDVLWVQETWAAPHEFDALKPTQIPSGALIHYAATANLGGTRGLGDLEARPSMNMREWMARLYLDVVATCEEPVEAITEEGARADGFADRAAFLDWWRGAYGNTAGVATVIRFKRVRSLQCAQHAGASERMSYLAWHARADQSVVTGERQAHCAECRHWFWPWELR